MARTIGLIEWTESGDVSSRRLAWRRFYDRPLVEWVARRLSDAELLGEIYVSLPELQERPDLAQSLPPDVRPCSNSGCNRLARLVDLAQHAQCDGIVCVRLDAPLVDPGLIDRLIRTAQDGTWDYVTFVCRDGRPVMHSQIGLGAEWFSSRSLRRLREHQPASAEGEDITGRMLQADAGFASRFLPLPDGLDHPELRLTLADDDDWDTALAIVETLGCESLDWPHIANWLDSHPQLLKQMESHSANDAR